MSIQKLVQTGEDKDGVFNVMDGLSFARAINNNADELSTETKLDLEIYNTPEAIAKALKEQAGKIGFHTPGGPDDLPTFEEEGAPVNSPSKQEGGIAQIYNEALEDGGDTYPEVILYKDTKVNNMQILNNPDKSKLTSLPEGIQRRDIVLGRVEDSDNYVQVTTPLSIATIKNITWQVIDSNLITAQLSSENLTNIQEYVDMAEEIGAVCDVIYIYDEIKDTLGDLLVDKDTLEPSTDAYKGEGWYFTMATMTDDGYKFIIIKLEDNFNLIAVPQYEANIMRILDVDNEGMYVYLDELDATGIVHSVEIATE